MGHDRYGPVRLGRRLTAATAVVALGALAAGCGTNSSGGSGGSGGSGSSGGESFKPTGTVHMDVPFAPGGGSDVFGRAMAKGFEDEQPGLTVTVENRPAGSGAVGYTFLFSKKGDPNYILPSETTGVALPLTTKTPWTWRDFTPIMEVASDTNLLVVPKASPYQNLKQVIADLKQNKHVTMGLTGATSVDAIVTGLMEGQKGVKFDRVIFQSGEEEVKGLLDGSVAMAMLNPSEVIGEVKSGDLRPIAAFAEKRYTQPPLDKVPTAKEQGVDVDFVQYRGLFAAGGITSAQEKYWETTAKKWTQSADFAKYLKDNYLQKTIRSHKQFVSYLADYEKTIKAALAKNGRG
jgi:putative tricarboxylic transport membrane protein